MEESHMYSYWVDDNYRWHIQPEQAEIIKHISKEVLSEETFNTICEDLASDGNVNK